MKKSSTRMIDDLITAAQKEVVTEEGVRALKKRLKKADDRFEEERKMKEADPQSFLRREYTI